MRRRTGVVATLLRLLIRPQVVPGDLEVLRELPFRPADAHLSHQRIISSCPRQEHRGAESGISGAPILDPRSLIP